MERGVSMTDVPRGHAGSSVPVRVLVTGATGYIGGRLVPRLVARGHQVRCAARDPNRLAGHDWPGVEIVAADLNEPSALAHVLEGVDVAYYLVHSMADSEAFRERDRVMADAFGRAAAHAGVGKIIYLGGLGDPDDDPEPAPRLPPRGRPHAGRVPACRSSSSERPSS